MHIRTKWNLNKKNHSARAQEHLCTDVNQIYQLFKCDDCWEESSLEKKTKTRFKFCTSFDVYGLLMNAELVQLQIDTAAIANHLLLVN